MDPALKFGFGDFLKAFRKKGRLTQRSLSQRIGVREQTVNRWEKHKTFPPDRYLPHLAGFLKISLVKLLKMKEGVFSRRQHLKISACKDPVVSISSPRYVPVLDKKSAVLPLEGIRHPQTWRGKRCPLPDDLFPGNLFGFEVGDKSMEPDYPARRIVLADLKAPLKDNQAVVIKVKGHPPLCRFHSRRHSVSVLSASDPKASVVRVHASHVEWCHAIVTFVSPIRNISEIGAG